MYSNAARTDSENREECQFRRRNENGLEGELAESSSSWLYKKALQTNSSVPLP